MKIYYREKSGGIEILRCFGIEGRVEIPGMIDGKLVISAAPYAFSSHMDEKEDLKNASLWEVSDGLEFGREEHVLAGNDVEEIVFPYTLKEIGRYIFYGCGTLFAWIWVTLFKPVGLSLRILKPISRLPLRWF